MFTIRIVPARRWFGGRRQYRFVVVAGNGQRISDRDTYANPGDIVDVLTRLVASDVPVRLDIRERDGSFTERWLR